MQQTILPPAIPDARGSCSKPSGSKTYRQDRCAPRHSINSDLFVSHDDSFYGGSRAAGNAGCAIVAH